MAVVTQESGPTVALFSVWGMNGGPVPESAVTKIEKFIETVLARYEQHENVRLLTQTIRGD